MIIIVDISMRQKKGGGEGGELDLIPLSFLCRDFVKGVVFCASRGGKHLSLCLLLFYYFMFKINTHQ